MSQFNEDNTVEQLFIETLKKNGWKYIPAEQLDRELSDVMVELMVKNALIRLNLEIEEEPFRAAFRVYTMQPLFPHRFSIILIILP